MAPFADELSDPLACTLINASAFASFAICARSEFVISTSLVSRIIRTLYPLSSSSSLSCRLISRVSSYSGTPVYVPLVPPATFVLVWDAPGPIGSCPKFPFSWCPASIAIRYLDAASLSAASCSILAASSMIALQSALPRAAATLIMIAAIEAIGPVIIILPVNL